MTIASVVLLVVPRWIARIYTTDEFIIGVPERCCGWLGISIVRWDSIGWRRGFARCWRYTHANAVPFHAYWIIGLAAGSVAVFSARAGSSGIVGGAEPGLDLIGIVLLVVWRRKVRKLISDPREAGRFS